MNELLSVWHLLHAFLSNFYAAFIGLSGGIYLRALRARTGSRRLALFAVLAATVGIVFDRMGAATGLMQSLSLFGAASLLMLVFPERTKQPVATAPGLTKA